MRAYYSERHQSHAPDTFIARGQVTACPETPQRADILLQATKDGGHTVLAPKSFDIACLRRVHDAKLIDFLEQAWSRWQSLPGAGSEVVPNVHPSRNMGGISKHIVGLAGHYQADTACPIGEGTWDAARASADTALSAADAVMDDLDSGEPAPFAYALARPPGHHAFADQAGGFCYLNNSAIAAEHCIARGARKVAVLDVDVHHGNGTQGIFYRRNDVLTISLHGDPNEFYPFYLGFAGENGADEGQGYNINHPLPFATGDLAYINELDRANEALGTFKPDVLVLALGLDASEHDSLAGFLRVTTAGFRQIGERIGQLNLPTVLVQEGGYVSPVLGDNLIATLAGYESTR